MANVYVVVNGKSVTMTGKAKYVFVGVFNFSEFDLSKPIWLDSTVADFKKHDRTRFYQDNFVDKIDFDYLEIHVIEED